MELQQFIKDLEEQFDEVPEGTITPQTKYKEIDEYSSLTAMCIIGMVDSKYGVTLSGEVLAQCDSVDDLFQVVKGNDK
jgi:acyl carrier protein